MKAYAIYFSVFSALVSWSSGLSSVSILSIILSPTNGCLPEYNTIGWDALNLSSNARFSRYWVIFLWSYLILMLDDSSTYVLFFSLFNIY